MLSINLRWNSPIVILLTIMALALMVRLVGIELFWEVPHNATGDTYWYHQTALNFLETGKYVNHSDKALTAFRQPGYTWFVAAVYYIFNHNYIMLPIMQAIIGVISVALVYILAKHLVSTRLSLLAALFYAIWPSLAIIYVPRLYVETIYGAFAILALIQAVIFLKNTSIRNAIILGVVLGISLYFRPTLILFPGVVMCLMLINRAGLFKTIGRMAIVSIVILAVLSPWVLRNYLVFDEFILLGTYGAYNFAWVSMEPTGYATSTPYYPPYADLPEGDAKAFKVDGEIVAYGFVNSTVSEQITNYIQYEMHWHQDGRGMKMWLAWIKGDFMTWLDLRWDVVHFLWKNDMISKWWGLKSWMGIQSTYLSFLALTVLATALVSFRAIRDFIARRSVPASMLLVGMMIYWNLFHILLFGHPRHHMVVIPVIIVMGFVAISELLRLRRWVLDRPKRNKEIFYVRPIDYILNAVVSPEEQKELVAKWQAWKASYNLTPEAYTEGDIRHQKEYAINRLGKIYRRMTVSGRTEEDARTAMLRYIERALVKQQTPRHEITPALNNFPGVYQIQHNLDYTYGERFYIKHRHADGFIRELLIWKAKIENDEPLTYEIPL